MPYPNEHSARVKEPGQFDLIRRENDKFGPGIHAIWGVKTGQGTEIQAVRFDKTKFTVEEAKLWLEKHKISYIKFEPALNESEIRGSMNDIKQKIEHTGVMGMKWGHRKGTSGEPLGLIPKLLGRKENFRVGKPKGMSNAEFDKQYANETSGGSKKKPDTSSAEHKTVQGLKKKKISEMSNDELRKVATRLQLEQQYKNLNPSKVSKGKKLVAGLLGDVAKGVANQATQYAAQTIFNSALKLAKVKT